MAVPFGKLGANSGALCNENILLWNTGVSFVIMCIWSHIGMFYVVNSDMDNMWIS